LAASLFTLGLNHVTAPLPVRERVVFHVERLHEALGELKRGLASEAAILSTCNRTEVYVAGERPAELAPLNVLIQVNVSAEGTKSGLAPAQVEALAQAVSAMPRLRLRGLMAIPAPGADRSAYRQMKQIYDSLQSRFAFDTLSMGMSDDLDLALEEGATMVRVGTAIFGARNKQKDAA
jgi:pyridoxal phosphate enzyme (YggS family)